MNKIKKPWIIVAVVIIVLVFTNPTNKDLENFMAAKGFNYDRNEGGRIYYLGIFSIFKADIGYRYEKPDRIYLGIFKNFICLKKSD